MFVLRPSLTRTVYQLVRHVADAEDVGRALADADVRHVWGRKLGEVPVGEVEHGAIGPLDLLVGADLLHRLQLRVLVIPDVDRDQIRGI
jgi:hypothetical protein